MHTKLARIPKHYIKPDHCFSSECVLYPSSCVLTSPSPHSSGPYGATTHTPNSPSPISVATQSTLSQVSARPPNPCAPRLRHVRWWETTCARISVNTFGAILGRGLFFGSYGPGS